MTSENTSFAFSLLGHGLDWPYVLEYKKITFEYYVVITWNKRTDLGQKSRKSKHYRPTHTITNDTLQAYLAIKNSYPLIGEDDEKDSRGIKDSFQTFQGSHPRSCWPRQKSVAVKLVADGRRVTCPSSIPAKDLCHGHLHREFANSTWSHQYSLEIASYEGRGCHLKDVYGG
jgi:hypothetical protein